MKKTILLLIVLLFCNILNMAAKKKGGKELTEAEFKKAVTTYDAKVIYVPQLSSEYNIYYSGEPNVLLHEHTAFVAKTKTYSISYNRDEILAEWAEIRRSQLETPLKGMNDIIQNLEAQKDDLINTLFDSLKMKRPEHLLSTDLSKMDAAIKKYGYKNAFQKLMLNMNVFCGECVREKKPGKWTYKDNAQHPGELIPVFVDNEGRNYEFEIFTRFFKQFYEFKKFSIKETVEFALLPTLGAYPNPSLTDPRTQKPKE